MPGPYALAAWLKRCGTKTVAMESTGVYWILLFQILEDRGFEVHLVNARHVKNVPGRRTVSPYLSICELINSTTAAVSAAVRRVTTAWTPSIGGAHPKLRTV
jgi:transposase